ncbi:MAG: hypothetical protein ACXWXZ_16265 [Candidatus Binatia bacterium]
MNVAKILTVSSGPRFDLNTVFSDLGGDIFVLNCIADRPRQFIDNSPRRSRSNQADEPRAGLDAYQDNRAALFLGVSSPSFGRFAGASGIDVKAEGVLPAKCTGMKSRNPKPIFSAHQRYQHRRLQSFTALRPMAPPPPFLSTTMVDCPRLTVNFPAISRAIDAVTAPGGNRLVICTV